MVLSLDKFVLATIFVILFSYFFYSTNNNFNVALEWISTIGIALIFFFYGLKLSPEKLRNGLKNWKLHLVVQASTFLIFPCLVLPFYFL
ncbi:MAG: bile acid:sodium symporter, partial [Bacteroidetes bacterium]|nr:bile acid:sodium symporter [Bacteroidota bacterium]